jgi:hypothetical protein
LLNLRSSYNPWLGDIQAHLAHGSGPHDFPHIQIMIRNAISGSRPWTARFSTYQEIVDFLRSLP